MGGSGGAEPLQWENSQGTSEPRASQTHIHGLGDSKGLQEWMPPQTHVQVFPSKYDCENRHSVTSVGNSQGIIECIRGWGYGGGSLLLTGCFAGTISFY